MNADRPALPETADVVVIGAGIAGISAAWFLHKAGLRVTVCEKGIVAGEQSSRNWGWCRQQGRDRAEQVEGLWISTGFSGHGFGIGPGAGRIMADLIQNKTVDHDLSRFRLARFSDGSKLELGPAI